LYVRCGRELGHAQYELYDEMYVEDDEWEREALASPVLLCLAMSKLSLSLLDAFSLATG